MPKLYNLICWSTHLRLLLVGAVFGIAVVPVICTSFQLPTSQEAFASKFGGENIQNIVKENVARETRDTSNMVWPSTVYGAPDENPALKVKRAAQQQPRKKKVIEPSGRNMQGKNTPKKKKKSRKETTTERILAPSTKKASKLPSKGKAVPIPETPKFMTWAEFAKLKGLDSILSAGVETEYPEEISTNKKNRTQAIGRAVTFVNASLSTPNLPRETLRRFAKVLMATLGRGAVKVRENETVVIESPATFHGLLDSDANTILLAKLTNPNLNKRKITSRRALAKKQKLINNIIEIAREVPEEETDFNSPTMTKLDVATENGFDLSQTPARNSTPENSLGKVSIINAEKTRTDGAPVSIPTGVPGGKSDWEKAPGSNTFHGLVDSDAVSILLAKLAMSKMNNQTFSGKRARAQKKRISMLNAIIAKEKLRPINDSNINTMDTKLSTTEAPEKNISVLGPVGRGAIAAKSEQSNNAIHSAPLETKLGSGLNTTPPALLTNAADNQTLEKVTIERPIAKKNLESIKDAPKNKTAKTIFRINQKPKEKVQAGRGVSIAGASKKSQRPTNLPAPGTPKVQSNSAARNARGQSAHAHGSKTKRPGTGTVKLQDESDSSEDRQNSSRYRITEDEKLEKLKRGRQLKGIRVHREHPDRPSTFDGAQFFK